MRAAPPVRVALRRSRGWIAFVAVCGALAAAQALAWLAKGWFDAPAGAVVAQVAIGAPLGAWAVGAWAWRAQPPGTLQFDGARWQWLDRPGRVIVAVDLQAWMLLRFRPEGGVGRRLWIAASRRGAGAHWPALRAALYSSGADAAVDPPPPVAPPG